jgi:hypothetical protein
VLVAWVCLKNLLRTVVELGRATSRLVAHPAQARQGWRWTTIKIGFSLWVRGFFTLAVSRDLYAGTPVVYVNYLDYDVAAHAFGPRSRPALLALRRVDRALRQLWRVARRVPEHRYDIYVLADHGQAPCTPYLDLNGERRFERWIFEEFLDARPAEATEARPQSGPAAGIREQRRATPALFQRFLNYLEEDFLRGSDPEADQQDGVRVISAGPNAFLYVLNVPAPLDFDAIEQRFPGLAEQLSRSPGVGFVLARSAGGHCASGRASATSSASPSRGRSRNARTPPSSSRASQT